MRDNHHWASGGREGAGKQRFRASRAGSSFSHLNFFLFIRFFLSIIISGSKIIVTNSKAWKSCGEYICWYKVIGTISIFQKMFSRQFSASHLIYLESSHLMGVPGLRNNSLEQLFIISQSCRMSKKTYTKKTVTSFLASYFFHFWSKKRDT